MSDGPFGQTSNIFNPELSDSAVFEQFQYFTMPVFDLNFYVVRAVSRMFHYNPEDIREIDILILLPHINERGMGQNDYLEYLEIEAELESLGIRLNINLPKKTEHSPASIQTCSIFTSREAVRARARVIN